jgi:hypothetical protein
MRRLMACLLLVAISAQPASHANAEGQVHSNPPLPGARAVHFRDGDGRVAATTSIPSGSLFSRHGGRGAPCSWIDRDGKTDGQPDVPEGTTRQSDRWIFYEGVPILAPEPIVDAVIASKGPIDQAFRVFTVYCHSPGFETELGTITVTAQDPFWNLDGRIDDLLTALQLPRPVVATTPPGDWPGLIVNNPRPLQITDAPWQTFTATDSWRGWNLALIAQPASLTFTLQHQPHDLAPTTTHITCPNPQPADGLLPAMPALPDHASPTTPLPCAITPARRGTLTITATVTYTITYWINGYTDPLPDYAYSSTPATFTVGEIHAVNLDPHP